MSDSGDTKKLSDLRVVDLRAELEKRGLDTKGVKKDLLERLQKAIQSEGGNPESGLAGSGKRLSISSSQEDDKQESDNEDRDNSTQDGKPQDEEDCGIMDVDIAPKNTAANQTKKKPGSANHDDDDNTTLSLDKGTGEVPSFTENKNSVTIEQDKSDEKSAEPAEAVKEISTECSTPQETAEDKKSADANVGGSASTSAEETTHKKPSNPRLLWITNVPKNTRANELKQLLSSCGKVICAKVVVNARFPGSCCFGYITMGTAEDATNVIAKLNNTEFNGQIIKIDKFENIKPDSLNPSRKNKSSVENDSKKSDDANCKIKKEGVVVASGSSELGKNGDEDKEQKSSGNKSSPERTKSRTSDRSSRGRRRTSSRERDRSDSRGAHRANVLTFDKIKEERERQRVRERERALREDNRRRQEEAMRLREMREISRRQRNEAERLEREREKLRIERDRIEREKTEILKLERERQRIEREKLELERMELQRSRQRLEEDRRATKRPLPSGGPSGGGLPYRRDEPFDDRKRPPIDRHFDEPSRPPRFEPPTHSTDHVPPKKFAASKDFSNKRIPYEKHTTDVFPEKRGGRDYESDRSRPQTSIRPQTSMNRSSNPTMKYDRFALNTRDRDVQPNLSLRHNKESRFVERDRSPHYRPSGGANDRDRHLGSQKSERDHFSNTSEPSRFDGRNTWSHPSTAPSKSFSSSTPKVWNKSWRPDPSSNDRWNTNTPSSGRTINQAFAGNSNLPACPPPPGINTYSERFDYNKPSGIRKY